MGKSIRIHTTPGGDDKYVSLKIDQDFDFLEVLSIKIRQEEIYRQYCSDYGVLVGRVLLNDGFGAPNCKVSIFIPLEDSDEDNPLITSMYPFKQPTDQNDQFIRYNLLPDEKQNANHVSVGTFPSKRKVLNHQTTLDVYDKYYKFTTTTNQSGDYMIFGIPVGNQQVHFDLDVGDMGNISLTPQDLVASGVDENEFTQDTTNTNQTVLRYKSNTNLDILPQIKSHNSQVNIEPFWGDEEQCSVGITRLDWAVEGTFIPSAIFFGGSFMETTNERLGRDWAANVATPPNRCERNGNGDWNNGMRTEAGYVQYIGLRNNQPNNEAMVSIDSNGNWVLVLPMLEGRVKTDESGVLIPSTDNTGIPSYGDYRFLFGLDDMDDIGASRNARAYGLCPQQSNPVGTANAWYQLPQTPGCSANWCLPLSDPASTNSTDTYGYLDQEYTNFYRFKAGRVYSIAQLVAHPSAYAHSQNDLIMRNIGTQPSAQNPFPTNGGPSLWGMVFGGTYVIGSYYFMQFNISNGGLHCSDAVYGRSVGSGNNSGIGERRSERPFFYLTNSNGATYVKDITALQQPNFDFFTDKEFSIIPSQLKSTSHAAVLADNLIYGDYWYFGLHVDRSSLDVVKDMFNI